MGVVPLDYAEEEYFPQKRVSVGSASFIVANTTRRQLGVKGHYFDKWFLDSAVEQYVLGVVRDVMRDGARCRELRGGRPPLVLDIGANEAFHGLLSGAWGCDSHIYEPQPACAQEIAAAIHANRFAARARVVPRPVSAAGVELKVSTTAPCFGGFPYHPSLRSAAQTLPPTHKARHYAEGSTRRVTSVSLEEMYGREPEQPIALVKIDTEGHEIDVLRRATHDAPIPVHPVLGAPLKSLHRACERCCARCCR